MYSKSWRVYKIAVAENIIGVVSAVTKVRVAETSPRSYRKRWLGCPVVLVDSESRRPGSVLDAPGVARYLETVGKSDVSGPGLLRWWLTRVVVFVGLEELTIVRTVSFARGLVFNSECPWCLARLLGLKKRHPVGVCEKELGLLPSPSGEKSDLTAVCRQWLLFITEKDCVSDGLPSALPWTVSLSLIVSNNKIIHYTGGRSLQMQLVLLNS